MMHRREFLILSALSPLAALAAEAPPEPRREFRGAWVASVFNLNWPSRAGLPVEQQKRELKALLDRAVTLRLNAIVLQVRPSSDAAAEGDAAEPTAEQPARASPATTRAIERFTDVRTALAGFRFRGPVRSSTRAIPPIVPGGAVDRPSSLSRASPRPSHEGATP